MIFGGRQRSSRSCSSCSGRSSCSVRSVQRTRGLDDATVRQIALWAFLIATAGIIAGGLIGRAVLAKWHVSIPALQITGALQWRMLSDSSLSFNTIHDRTKRCETAFLKDGTWLADRLAAEAGLDVESDRFAHVLWEAATSAFFLECWFAERKFGPHFVVAKTPIANIRLTTFFAGEAEVRLVDPSEIRVLESVGCTVET
jgi:hypothetical protein